MSDNLDEERRAREQTSIFDERPGINANDDARTPEAVTPDVIAPDLGKSTVFDDGTLPIPNGNVV